MAYDHSADLPETYPITLVRSVFTQPDQLATIHATTELNLLNRLGHATIGQKIESVYGTKDRVCTILGVVLYEAATDTILVGGDFAGTPTYCDPVGSRIAEEILCTFKGFDAYDVEAYGHAAAAIMKESAPNLKELLEAVITDTVGLTDEALREAIVGASLLRNIHITAQQHLAA